MPTRTRTPTLNSVVITLLLENQGFWGCVKEFPHGGESALLHFARGTIGDYLSFIEHGYPVGNPEHTQYVVAYHDIRLLQSQLRFLDEVRNSKRNNRVEGAR